MASEPALYLLCGLPFSGKSTLAAELSSRLPAALVSLDAINAERGLDGGQGIAEEEWARTHEIARGRTAALLDGGHSVVDDTFCWRSLRDAFRAIATARGLATRVVFVDPPFEEIARRRRENDRARRRAPIDDAVFARVVASFEPPEEDETAGEDRPAAALGFAFPGEAEVGS